jgi:hypothetical protein
MSIKTGKQQNFSTVKSSVFAAMETAGSLRLGGTSWIPKTQNMNMNINIR